MYNEYIRIGKCLPNCGKCCFDCIHLNKNNQCNCYNNRPEFCIKDFPRTPDDLINWRVQETCGYRFVRI